MQPVPLGHRKPFREFSEYSERDHGSFLGDQMMNSCHRHQRATACGSVRSSRSVRFCDACLQEPSPAVVGTSGGIAVQAAHGLSSRSGAARATSVRPFDASTSA